MNAHTPRETADHIGKANEKVTADHTELARLAEAATRGEWWNDDDVISHQEVSREDERFIYAFSPAVCSALLSEIAALRGERDEQEATKLAAYDRLSVEILARDQAERQRDEALEAARKLSAAINWTDYPFIDSNTSREELISRLGFMQKDAEQPRAFLANQGADQ